MAVVAATRQVTVEYAAPTYHKMVLHACPNVLPTILIGLVLSNKVTLKVNSEQKLVLRSKTFSEPTKESQEGDNVFTKLELLKKEGQ